MEPFVPQRRDDFLALFDALAASPQLAARAGLQSPGEPGNRVALHRRLR